MGDHFTGGYLNRLCGVREVLIDPLIQRCDKRILYELRPPRGVIGNLHPQFIDRDVLPHGVGNISHHPTNRRILVLVKRLHRGFAENPVIGDGAQERVERRPRDLIGGVRDLVPVHEGFGAQLLRTEGGRFRVCHRAHKRNRSSRTLTDGTERRFLRNTCGTLCCIHGGVCAVGGFVVHLLPELTHCRTHHRTRNCTPSTGLCRQRPTCNTAHH